MRYEIYQLRGGEWEYLDEGNNEQEIVKSVYALAERNKGQIIVIDNTKAAIPGMSMPGIKMPMDKRHLYDLLLECKLSRLLAREWRLRGEGGIEDFFNVYDALQECAAEEVAALLGWETMRQLAADGATGPGDKEDI